MLFFCCSIFYVQQTKAASEPVVRANEVERGIWQVDTPRPTAKQLMALYDIESTEHLSRITVDDASVDYHQTGTYTIRFLIDGKIHLSVPFVVQIHTPLPIPYDLIFERDIDATDPLKDFMMKALFGEKYQLYTLDWLAQPPSMNQVGTFTVPIRLRDAYGRQVQKQATIHMLDREKPEISIEHAHLYYQKGDILTEQQIIQDAKINVQDASNDIEPQIDISKVKKLKEGRYPVTVTAHDMSGNQAIPQTLYIHIENVQISGLQYELGEPISIQKLKRDLAPLPIQGMDLTRVDFKKIGQYELPVYLTADQTRLIPIVISDTTPPSIKMKKKKQVYTQGDKITIKRILDDLQAEITDYDQQELTLELSKPIQQITKVGKHAIELIGRDRSGNEVVVPVQIDVLQSDTAGDHFITPPLFKSKMIVAEQNQEKLKTENLQSTNNVTTASNTSTTISFKNRLPIFVFLLLIFALLLLRTKRVLRKNFFFHRRLLK